MRLYGIIQDYEAAAIESKGQLESLRKDLSDAFSEQHRLEDQLELRQQELDRMEEEVRNGQRMIIESQKLAESEVATHKDVKTDWFAATAVTDGKQGYCAVK
jgi:predicted  nucleic acid-binding Zn-ribbon protein